MIRSLRRVLLVAALCLLGAAPLPAQRPRLLSTDSLAAWQAARRPHRLLDIRSDVFTYLTGHLPDAVYVNTETLRAASGGVPVQLLEPEWYRALFSRLGVRLDEPVVVYSAGETRNIDATFLVWLLEGFGHPQVYLLDGGYFKWELEHRVIARTYPKVTPARKWETRPFRPRSVALEQVLRDQERGAVIVDARPPDQFAGEAGAQMRRGHIPGAINRYWQDDLEQVGFGRVFKPVERLRAEYAALGITPDKEIIAYCNSATEASHVLFTLSYLLGYPRVRLYPGSWTEWAERAELPVAVGR